MLVIRCGPYTQTSLKIEGNVEYMAILYHSYHPTNAFPMSNRVSALLLQISYELLDKRYGLLYVFIYVNFQTRVPGNHRRQPALSRLPI